MRCFHKTHPAAKPEVDSQYNAPWISRGIARVMLILLYTSTSSALCKTFGRGCTTRLTLTFSHETNSHYSTIIERVSPLLNLLKEQYGASGIITKASIPNISNRPLNRKRRCRLILPNHFKLLQAIKQGTSIFREGVDQFR